MSRKTVDSVLKGFSKLIHELEVVITQSRNEAEKNDDKVRDLKNQSVALRVEAARAESITANLKKLIEG